MVQRWVGNELLVVFEGMDSLYWMSATARLSFEHVLRYGHTGPEMIRKDGRGEEDN